MCLDPVTATAIVSAGIQIAGGASQASGGRSAARESYRSAAGSRSNQQRSLDRQLITENRANNQQGYDAVLASRAAAASAENSSASAGIRGLSMDALINEQKSIGARNQSRINDARVNSGVSHLAASQDLTTQLEDRNRQTAQSTPTFGILDILIPVAGAAASISGNSQDKRAHQQQKSRVGGI